MVLPLPPKFGDHRNVPLCPAYAAKGVKPRFLHILGKHSTNRAIFPAQTAVLEVDLLHCEVQLQGRLVQLVIRRRMGDGGYK